LCVSSIDFASFDNFSLNFGHVEMFRQYGSVCFSFLLVNKDADVIEHERLSNFTLGHELT